MSLCDEVQLALIEAPGGDDVGRLNDESVPRVEGLEAHVASCEACGRFAKAQRAAVRLAGRTPTRGGRRSMRAIGTRAALLVVVLGASVFGATAWTVGWKQGEPQRPEQPYRAEQPPQVVEAPPPATDEEQEAARQWAALQQLQAFADSSVRREWREEDVTLRVFGALPGWVAPNKTSPLRSLGKAASPVVYTQEDVP